jgi:hypothetical protein
MNTQLHENLRRDEEVPRASERSFGILFFVVFAVIAAWPIANGAGVRWWAAVIAVVFAALALIYPRILMPLNSAWLALGKILHRVVSPIVLGFVYVIAVVPTGLFLRLTGRDPLRLKLEPDATTYWQQRDPPGPPPGSLKNQF